MIKTDFSHLLFHPHFENIERKLKEIKSLPAPSFETTVPDLSAITKKLKKYQQYKNLILIANGGSKTNAHAFCGALFYKRNEKNIQFITSSDPAPIVSIKKRFSNKNTLVLVTSKSGDNINSLEPALCFPDYPTLVITGEKPNPLSEIAQEKKWEIIHHPEVGGRFSGMTTCGLVPACLVGLNIKELYKGAQAGYKKYNYKVPMDHNNALKLAAKFYQLEKLGYTEIFTSIYSQAFSSFLPLMTQLIHETTGKNRLGQTIYGDSSPESHHHTNQRLLGGRKNVAALFISIKKPETDFQTKIPKNISHILFKNHPLKALAGIKASEALKFDMQGVLENCLIKRIPAIKILLDEVSEKSVGEFMVFWQYFSVYSALLRGQNPFDQPEVELAKIISYKLRTDK